jgi:hypothetical protein
MKKIFTLSVTLIYLGLVSFTVFEKKIGSSNCYEEGYSVIPLESGFLVSGNYNCSGGSTNWKSYLVLLNEAGDTVWSRKDLMVSGIAKKTSDDNLVFIGGNYAGLVYDSIRISKADQMGNMLWSNSFLFGVNKNSVTDIVEVSDGFVVTGFFSTSTNANPSFDAFVMKLDLNGNKVFSTVFTGNFSEQFHNVKVISKGIIVAAGWSNSLSANNKADYLIAMYDEDGNFIKSETYGSLKDNFCYGLEVLNDGTFMLSGYSDSMEMMHVRADLSLASLKTYQPTCGSSYFKVKKTSDNGLAVVGTESVDGRCVSVFYKMKNNGEVVWKKTMNGQVRDFNETVDGKFVMTGYADYLPDMYVVMFDSLKIHNSVLVSADNNIKDVNIESLLTELGITTKVDEALLESKYPSVKVFPNPASQMITVKFNNPGNKSYRMEVFDLGGKIVYVQGDITSSEFMFYRGNISKGVYTYRLFGEGNSHCGKFIFD